MHKRCVGCKQLPLTTLCKTSIVWDIFPEITVMDAYGVQESHPNLTINSPKEFDWSCSECNTDFRTSIKNLREFPFCKHCNSRLISGKLPLNNMVSITSNIIKDCATYRDYEDVIRYLPFTPGERGVIQEVFCKFYFLAHAQQFNVKNYYSMLLDEKDPKLIQICEKYRLPKVDLGTDGIIEHNDGTFSLVQCKWRSHTLNLQRNALGGMSIDALTSRRKKLKHVYIFSNTPIGVKRIRSNNIYKSVLYDTISHINWNYFKNVVEYIVSGKSMDRIHRATAPKPLDWQDECLKQALRGMKKYGVGYRQRVTAACGVGKTLWAYFLLQRIMVKSAKHHKFLVVVPSLYLLAQWFYVFSLHCKNTTFILVGSQFDEKEVDIPYTLTTNVSEIHDQLTRDNADCVVCISTYQSLDRVVAAMEDSFSVVFADEAHITATSKKKSNYSLVTCLDFPAEYIFFLTATERVYKGRLKEKCISMDNDQIYGGRYEYSFRRAIDEKILCDYSIATCYGVDITVNKIRRIELHARCLIRFVQDYTLEKVLVVSGIHSSSKRLYNEVKRQLEASGELSDYTLILMPCNATSTDKNAAIYKLERERTLLFNVRVFNLGADIPPLQAVFFNDEKNSQIDIVQTASRCLRIHALKEHAYILIPCVTNGSIDDPTGDFFTVRNIILSMGSVDSAIREEYIGMSAHRRSEGVYTGSKRLLNVLLEEDEFDIGELETIIYDRFGKIFDRDFNKCGITFEKAKKIIRNAESVLIGKDDYYDLCGNDSRLPRDPEHTFKGQFTTWMNYLNICGDFYDLQTCRQMVATYLRKNGQGNLLDPDKVCTELCEIDESFPPIGLWVDYYNVNDIRDIIRHPIRKKKWAELIK